MLHNSSPSTSFTKAYPGFLHATKILCKLCDSFNATDPLKLAKANNDDLFYSQLEHHKRYDDLLAAASSGCELCLLLQQQCEEEELKILEGPAWGPAWGPFQEFRTEERDGTFTREQKFRTMEAEAKYMNLRVGIVAPYPYAHEKFKEPKMFYWLTFTHWELVRHGAYERNTCDDETLILCYLQTPRRIAGLQYVILINMIHHTFTNYQYAIYRPKSVGSVRIGQFVLDGNLASETNFDIARGWMNTCFSEHSKSKCPSLDDKALLSRVISVGAKETDPFLILTNGVKGKYITLNHCWGGQIDTILTTSNLKSFQNKIEMSSLPANFRDAVLITRALGIEFLWIDSSCIIQDSKYDWEVESKKMGDVYRNCVLTIAAAASYRAADGILHNATQRRQGTKPKLKLSKDSGPDDVVEIVGASWEQEDLRTAVFSGPLKSRAWTFQEKIFSPRTLWYSRRQIYWQCLCGYQSADGNPSSGNGFPVLVFNYTTITQGIIHSKSYSDESPNISKIEFSDINYEYHKIIQDYCGRNLSYPGDKLPAFSGIAALIRQTIGGHYLAGIWSKFFRESLGWHRGRQRGGKVSHTKP